MTSVEHNRGIFHHNTTNGGYDDDEDDIDDESVGILFHDSNNDDTNIIHINHNDTTTATTAHSHTDNSTNIFARMQRRCNECYGQFCDHTRQIRLGYMLFLIAIVLLAMTNSAAYLVIGLALLSSFALSFCLRYWILRRHQQRQQRGRMNEQEMARLLQSMGISPAQVRLSMMDRDFNPNDYETLMALDEDHRFRGIPQSQIERLPSYHVPPSAVREDSNSDNDDEDNEQQAKCSICLEKVNVGDLVRTLPCLHRFHANCIDTWLHNKATCPVCTYRVVLS